MSREWADQVARYLNAGTACPRCDFAGFDGQCANCQLTLTVEQRTRIVTASTRAASAIQERQRVIEAAIAESLRPRVSVELPPFPASATIKSTEVVPGATTLPPGYTAAPVPQTAPHPYGALPVAAESASSRISIQSILALTGAALFAIAAIVFTFFNPDLTDFRTRTAITGGVTVLFLGGAWLLARFRLALSAEAVGALGMVFLALDIWAVSQLGDDGPPAWIAGATATGLAALLTTAIALLVKLRSWLWLAAFGFVLVPIFATAAWEDSFALGIGFGIAAFVSYAWMFVLRGLGRRFGSPLRADAVTSAVTRHLLLAVFVLLILFADYPEGGLRALSTAAALIVASLLALLSSRIELARSWSFLAGALVVSAGATAALAADLDGEMLVLFFTAAGALAAVAVVLPPRNGTAALAWSRLGAWLTLLTVALFPAYVVLLSILVRVADPHERPLPGNPAWLTIDVAAAASLAAVVVVALTLRHRLPRGSDVTGWWLAAAVVVGLSGAHALEPLGSLCVTLAAAAFLSILRLVLPAIRRLPLRFASPYLTAVHLLVVLAAFAAWSTEGTRVWGNTLALVVAGALMFGMMRALRPYYLAAAYAYSLVVLAAFLDDLGMSELAVLCLTTSAAAIVALIITLVDRVPAGYWYAVLAVTAIPFLLGVASVIAERSAWTALSTALIAALASTLVFTRRPGLTWIIRGVAATLVIPSLAVVVVCLTAAYLPTSGSPVALPLIAALVACGLLLTPVLVRTLSAGRVRPGNVRLLRIGYEVSVLLTGALAALLALVRAAAGLDTAIIVFGLIGVGSGLAALLQHARRLWVVAATALTLGSWCTWALLGVSDIEPYVLPPALAALVVGAVLVVLRRRGEWFFVAGLAAALGAPLVSLAVRTPTDSESNIWRVIALWTVSAALIVVGSASAGRFFDRIASLRVPSLIGACVAAAGAPIQAVRFAITEPEWRNTPDHQLLVLSATALSVGLAALAGYALSQRITVQEHRARWVYTPAVLYLVLGPIANVTALPVSYLGLFVLAAALLILMVWSSWRGRNNRTSLPPVWFLFTVAWFTAVASWSERELRVEAYSVPLGVALILAGIVGQKGARTASPEAAVHERSTPDALATSTNADPFERRGPRPNWHDWPNGYAGSWRTLAPGIIVTILPSMMATMTDPQTWRAVLVIALALAAILVGSLRKLAAPFLLGLIALPIENVLVFVAQIGRTIDAATWWMTLATAGAVLLAIAFTFERRSSGASGVAARLRDMR